MYTTRHLAKNARLASILAGGFRGVLRHIFKNKPLVGLVFLLIFVGFGLQSTQNVSAVAKTSSLSPSDQAKSVAYYKGLRRCFETGFYKNVFTPSPFVDRASMSQVDADKFDWFNDNQSSPITIPVVPNATNIGVINDSRVPDGDGQQNCGGSEGRAWIAQALKLWQVQPADFLCSLGFTRDKPSTGIACTDMTAGVTNDFHAKSGTVQLLDDFWLSANTFKGVGLGNSSAGPEGTMAGEYKLYLDSFLAYCKPSTSGTTYTIKTFVTPNSKQTSNLSYGSPDRGRTPDTPVNVYYGRTETCRNLTVLISKDSDRAVVAYGTWAQTGDAPGDLALRPGTSLTNTEAPTCGSTVTSIGWIVCPVYGFIGGLNDLMWQFLSSLLTVSPVQENAIDSNGYVIKDSSGNSMPSTTYRVWSAFRTIANVILLIAFLVMIFSQLTGAGISNYGIKKLMPRWVVGAILINVSFPVMQIVVDIANIVGASLYSLIGNLAQFDPTTVSWDKLGGLIAGNAALQIGGVVVVAASVVAPAAVFALVLPLAIAAAFGFLAALAVLILRQALIPILIAIAPVAIALYLIPNTKPWFDKWKNLLVTMLMLFPIAGIVFGGAKLAAAVIAGGSGWWSTLLSLLVLSVPLFTLPFIARQTGPTLSKVGTTINGWGSGAKKLANNAMDPYKQRSIAQGRNRVPILGALSRRRTRAKLETQAYQSQETAAFNRELADNPQWAQRVEGKEAQSFMRGAVARAEAEELKAALQPLIAELAEYRAKGGDPDKFLLSRATSPDHTEAERSAAIQHAAALGRDGVLTTLINDPTVNQTVVRKAIGDNAGALGARAPHLVKGPEAAFANFTGQDMAGWSDVTAKAFIDHVEKMQASGNTAGVNAALADFASASKDIQNNPTLQATFNAKTGRMLIEEANRAGGANPALAGIVSAFGAVGGDGKIR